MAKTMKAHFQNSKHLLQQLSSLKMKTTQTKPFKSQLYIMAHNQCQSINGIIIRVYSPVENKPNKC